MKEVSGEENPEKQTLNQTYSAEWSEQCGGKWKKRR